MLRSTLVGALVTLSLTVAEAAAQRLPAGMTPEQALQLLSQNPQLGQVLRDRIRESGRTADEIRAQLRAAGLPPDMLDPFLASAGAAPDPSAEMLAAISRLGLVQFALPDPASLVEDSLRAESIAREDSLAKSRPELTLFGLDVFRQPSTQFRPLVTGPVDDSYVLGPGDELVLILTGAVELARQLPVTTSGFIVIPQVGQIHVNGLAVRQLRELLYDRLGRVYAGISRGPDPRTRFDIAVSNVRVHTIRVIGEVARPGSYALAATGTVLSAIYEAGGLTERGNYRTVQVRRGTRLLATVDLYDYLLQGTVSTDVALASGDVVFVPVRGSRVKIAGEVTRPAIYELRPGESLRDLISIAGGLTPYAATHTATIDRVLPPEQRAGLELTRSVVTVELGPVVAGAAPAVPMVAEDSVTIFSIRAGRRNAVTIKGDGVWQPGTYELSPGMRLSTLIGVAGGVRPEAYQGRVQLLRTYPDGTRRMIGARLTEASEPAPQPDLELHQLDEVMVFARTDFRTRRNVDVHGAVRRPGRVAYADSMTLRDAVLLAGGITEAASLLEAEVSRLREPGSDSGAADVLQVPLDSSYILDETGLFPQVGADAAPEVVLQPYDNVLIRRVPGFELPRNVVLTGEVRYPGTYTLLQREERLAGVLQRAGGLTEHAYPNGIRFFRNRMMRVGIDLADVLRNSGHPHNLILEAADSVHIVRYQPLVRVEGSVHWPGAVAYQPGAALDYYVDGAGGYTRDADKGRTLVQQPNGLIEKRGRPEPGAVVIVPQRGSGRGGPGFVAIMSALSPLLSAATAIVAVIVANK